METFPRATIALVCAGLLGSLGPLSGCFHYTAQVPGVLDLRSDGSTAVPNEAPLGVPAVGGTREAAADDADPITRTGVSSLFAGDGVVEQGTQFTVEERHWFLGLTTWAPGLFLISNPSSSEELDAALGGEAVRNLRVGHEVGLTDVLLTLGVGIVPVIGTCASLLVAPRPWTFTASGERIKAGPGVAVAPPLAAPADQPPPEPPQPDETLQTDEVPAGGEQPLSDPPSEDPPAEDAPPADSPAATPPDEAPTATDAPAAKQEGDK